MNDIPMYLEFPSTLNHDNRSILYEISGEEYDGPVFIADDFDLGIPSSADFETDIYPCGDNISMEMFRVKYGMSDDLYDDIEDDEESF